MEIYPSILEKKRSDIESRLKLVKPLVSQVQIDICDGQFVPSKTYASNLTSQSLENIRKMTRGKILELDLMIDLSRGRLAKDRVNRIKAIRPERVILHMGSTNKWGDIFSRFTRRGKLTTEIGLGVHLRHSITDISKLLDNYPFSFVQVMGIEKVGYSGQSFSKKAYKKISSIRKRYPKLPISVDGGVKISNAKKLKTAGTTRICPNSGLFNNSNIEEIYREFKKI